MTDPERLDAEIDDIDPDIEFEYGRSYNDLNDQEKEEVINNHFFISNPSVKMSHPQASRDIKLAIDGYRSGDVRGRDVKVRHITRRGRSYTVITDAETGEFRQWVRE
jgi:hypothetical protein